MMHHPGAPLNIIEFINARKQASINTNLHKNIALDSGCHLQYYGQRISLAIAELAGTKLVAEEINQIKDFLRGL